MCKFKNRNDNAMTTDNVMMRVADDKMRADDAMMRADDAMMRADDAIMRADDAVKPYGRVSQTANPIVRGVQC